MTNSASFSFPDNWNCLTDLMDKMPRSMDKSKTVKLAIEQMLESVTKTPFLSLDSFATKVTTPELTMTRIVFDKILRGMDIADIRDFKKLMVKRMGTVDDEIYKRTQ